MTWSQAEWEASRPVQMHNLVKFEVNGSFQMDFRPTYVKDVISIPWLKPPKKFNPDEFQGE